MAANHPQATNHSSVGIGSRVLVRLADTHDALTKAGFVFGAGVVGLMVLAFCYEVVSRYVFSAPTSWASASVSYGLCVSIFVAIPDLTRAQAHVAINLLADRMSPQRHARLAMAMGALAALVTLTAAVICAQETWDQYINHIETISVYSIPKWWLSAVITYGLLSAGLYFLRQVFASPRAHVESGAAL